MDHPEVRFRFYPGLSATAIEWEQGEDKTLSLVAKHYQWVLYNYNLALAGNQSNRRIFSRTRSHIIAECIRLEQEVFTLEGLMLYLAQELGSELIK